MRINRSGAALAVGILLATMACRPSRPTVAPEGFVEVPGGRVFYTSLGHNDAVWRDPRYQAHVMAGLQWVTHAEHGKPSEVR